MTTSPSYPSWGCLSLVPHKLLSKSFCWVVWLGYVFLLGSSKFALSLMWLCHVGRRSILVWVSFTLIWISLSHGGSFLLLVLLHYFDMLLLVCRWAESFAFASSKNLRLSYMDALLCLRSFNGRLLLLLQWVGGEQICFRVGSRVHMPKFKNKICALLYFYILVSHPYTNLSNYIHGACTLNYIYACNSLRTILFMFVNSLITKNFILKAN
jgi:hypothetical protein